MVTRIDHTEDTTVASWALPERYSELTPAEQRETLREVILAYLKANRRAAKSVLKGAISPPRDETFSKALEFLVTTQQIYVDVGSGSRDPVFYSNGRLAHAFGDEWLDLNPSTALALQVYDDPFAGRQITITQHTLTPSGAEPVSGIRFDWVDLEEVIRKLQEIQATLSGGLVRE